jgi:hypothetical protein
MALASTAAASTILFRTDAQLIAMSERVVHARVISQRFVPDGPDGRIYTVSTLAVIEDLTGREGDRIDVWELGGISGTRVFWVGGMVQYRPGSEVLVCLERGPRGLRSVAMGFSKFDVQRTSIGDGVLTRDLRDTSVIGGTVQARERSLAEFRQLAREVLGRPSRLAASGSDTPSRFEAGWTKIAGEPGYRWREADLGIPLRVYKNTSAPPPLLTGDAVAEIQTGLAAWTSPASASIVLNYAGTANEFSADGGWTQISEPATLITFEDPNDDFGPPVLAVGGGHVNTGTGGTVGGIVYDGYVRGFVVFQNAAELPASFRQSLNFTRVVTHEIGHTIGFGHTQTNGTVPNPTSNIMYPSCCAPETPVPPALGPDDLAGLNTIYPAVPVSGPSMTLDKTSIRFGATTSAGMFAAKTSAQGVRLTQAGAGNVSWTATATRPWLQVSPASGTGPANLSISVVPDPNLPAAGIADGAIIFTYAGASNTPGPVAVRLTLTPAGSSSNVFGVVETPANSTTGVTGAVPFTGWALDDIEVVTVSICRAAVAGEAPVIDARCGGAAQFFIGSAVFIDGARPDVQGAFPSHPLNSRAGWGFMVLTNMLPAQGNGRYDFSIYAQDREGAWFLLGTRTMTCDNANAVRPFGTIDTPSQGGVASGASYVNFGWALTPVGPTLPGKIIPLDGSTITVIVDGIARGTVSYNHERPDIEGLFPNYRNTQGPNGAIGFRVIDTTALTNGLHTISWIVTDDQGVTEGLGSRFFTVSNSTGTTTPGEVLAPIRTQQVVDAAPVLVEDVLGRRGWDDRSPMRRYEPGVGGRVLVRAEEVDRIELRLSADPSAAYSGWLRTSAGLAPLPVGSSLQGSFFTWAPGAGFVGTYDLVFVRDANTAAQRRQEVRVVLQPKSSGLVGPQVVIDTPRPQQDVVQPFVVAGWSADLRAQDSTGIDTLHVWAYPLDGHAPVFLGAAPYGGRRPDVAAIHGDRFEESGFGLLVQGLPAGAYDLAVFAWSIDIADFVPAKVVRVNVR